MATAPAAEPAVDHDQAAPPAQASADTSAAALSEGSVPAPSGPAAGNGQSPLSAMPATPAQTPASQLPVLTSGTTPSTARFEPVVARQPNIAAATASGATGVGSSARPADSEASGNNDDGPPLATARAERPKPQRPRAVDGFSRKDIPALLHLADGAARRGDYHLARYEYNLILRLDHANSTARKALEQLHADQATR
jgi:hypothetical protein